MRQDTLRVKVMLIEASGIKLASINSLLEAEPELDLPFGLRHLPFSGAVLAGGRSSRFKTDKALHVWQGKTLLEHVLIALSGCAETFVIGGDYALEGINVHPDLEPHPGSLYGVARALELARCERVAVTACDMPNLTRAYWEWLSSFPPCDVLIPRSASGDLEPLAAVYSRACLPFVQDSLERGQLKMVGWWAASLGVTMIDWLEVRAKFGEDVFLNANTPADLELG